MLSCNRKDIFILLIVLCGASIYMFSKLSTWYMRQAVHQIVNRVENHAEATLLKQLGVDGMIPALAHPSAVNSMMTALQPNSTTWCPDKPPFLVGPLASMPEEVTPQFVMEQFPELEKGGRLRPKDCTPRQRLALVIPYRNRYPHLHIVINNLLPTLKRQQADVTLFVIEQAPPEVFNRGALLNVGFLEAEKLASYDCYIFHDADMIPLNDHNFYRCDDNPRHYAVAINKFGYKLPYDGYVGAVVGFTKKQYLTINGCSNIYFGWGGEDDDTFGRVRNKNYHFLRYEPHIGGYNMIKHNLDLGNEVNALRWQDPAPQLHTALVFALGGRQKCSRTHH